MNSSELLRSRGGLTPRLSVRRCLPWRWRTRRWPWRGEWPAETASGERRSFGQQWRHGGAWERERPRQKRGRQGEWRRLGERGGIPTGSCRSEPGGRGHVANVRPPRGRHRVEKGGHVRARRGGGRSWAARLSGPKLRRVGPAAPAPLFFLFFISFSQIFSKHILTYLKSFPDLAPKTKVDQNK